MKTFDQFLIEAEFASRKDIKGSERHLQAGGAAGLQTPRTLQNRRDAQAAAQRAEAEKRRGQPIPQGTSGSTGQRAIAAQLAAQKAEKLAAEQKAKEAEELVAQKLKEPIQTEIRYMRTDKPHIPLSLDAKLIPKPPKLQKPAKKEKTHKQKTRQLRLPKI